MTLKTLADKTLTDLGWSGFFEKQLTETEMDATPPMRVFEVHRDRVLVNRPEGEDVLTLPPDIAAGDVAVGDWVLSDPETGRVLRLLDRRTVLHRRGAGEVVGRQLIAANVDTLFIVSSCNADFNPARLERYLALAGASNTLPVIVLTKGDLVEDGETYRKQAERLSPLVTALLVEARDAESLEQLEPWVRNGETAAMVGSSGVGKSTILNGLTGLAEATQGIREDDAKGRHTTTARSLRPTVSGGWLIDTPGMRSLGMSDLLEGIEQVFSDLSELAEGCKFSDCAHESEPGCAILAAVERGEIDGARIQRWRKLLAEDRHYAENIAQSRSRHKGLSKMYRAAQKKKSR